MAKKAVLVGINRYQIPGADLRGCVNDVIDMRALLTERYGFDQANIETLTDFDATKSNIQDALDRLVSGGEPGDTLVFHFAGHGSNVPDKDGDEADERDEILCPTDLDWRDPLLDDWLRQLFDTIEAGVNLTALLDCCHSGTATRVLTPPDSVAPMARFLPSPWDLVAAESGRPATGASRSIRRGMPRETPADDVVDVDIPELLISGCRDDQTSADAHIEGDFHGAFTYSLVNAVRSGADNPTYRDLHTRTLSGLGAGGFDQRPQLEGRADTFAIKFLDPFA